MSKYGFLASLCLLAFTSFAASREDPAITVAVEARVLVEPDRVYLLVYSKATDTRAEAAMEKALNRIKKAVEDIQRKHGRKISYDIVNSGIERVDDKTECKYIGMYCVRLNCPADDEKIFSIVDDAREYDVNDENEVSVMPPRGISSGLPFSPIIYAVEDHKAAEDRLETEVLAVAKARAENIAKKEGKKLGEILSVELGLIESKGRNLDLPTPYISDNRNGVIMAQPATVSYQLLSAEETQ
jgi:hypothetical protein